MIAWLKGLVLEKAPPTVVLNVNGVGYRIESSMNTFFTLPEAGKEVALHIHTQIREDAHLLFGFNDKLERDLFVQLIKVNGVGPKVALSLLSSLSPQLLFEAIQSQDIDSLVKVPGVGKKTAQRLLLDLKDVPQQEVIRIEHLPVESSPNAQQEAMSALIALGYKQHEAQKAVKRCELHLSCEDMIRQALKNLS